MADSKLKIQIGTSYNGEGMTKLRSGAQGAQTSIGRLQSSLKSLGKAAKGIGSNLMNIQAGFSMLKSAASSLLSIFSESFKFDEQTRQFEVLTGSMDSARAHMQMLKQLGDTPPFSLDAFAAASRELMVLTNGLLGGKESLEMIGDAAAATGIPLDQMTSSIGHFYEALLEGEPIDRYAKQLAKTGVIGPKVASQLIEMSKDGTDAAEVWDKLTSQLGKYQGAMDKVAQTGKGLTETISGTWTNIVRQFGDGLSDTANGGLKEVSDKLKALEESGVATRWAMQLADYIREYLLPVLSAVGSGVGKIMSLFGDAASFFGKAGAAVGGMIGAKANGASWSEAWDAGYQEWESVYNAEQETAKEIEEAVKKTKIESAKETAKAVEEVVKESASKQTKIEIDAAREALAAKARMERTRAEQREVQAAANSTSSTKDQADVVWADWARRSRSKSEAARLQGIEARDKAEVDKLNRTIESIKSEIQKFEKQQREADELLRGGVGQTGGDGAGGGNGINGSSRYGSYNPHYDNNGNLSPQDLARASRIAAGAQRDAGARAVGPNRLKQMQQDRQDLQDQLDRKGKLDKRDQQKLDNLNKFFKADELQNALKAAQKAKDAAEKQMWTDVGEIKAKLDQLGLK